MPEVMGPGGRSLRTKEEGRQGVSSSDRGWEPLFLGAHELNAALGESVSPLSEEREEGRTQRGVPHSFLPVGE